MSSISISYDLDVILSKGTSTKSISSHTSSPTTHLRIEPGGYEREIIGPYSESGRKGGGF